MADGALQEVTGRVTRQMTDYYKILQVDRDATPAVISAAYRRLMREAHPDVGGRPEEAVRLNEAHDVLSDSARRREYDRQLLPSPIASPRTGGGYSEALADELQDNLVKHAQRLQQRLRLLKDQHRLP